MKNIVRLGLAILLISVTAVPAMAKLDIGGAVIADCYYYQQDKEGFAYVPPGSTGSRTTPGSGGLAGFPDGYESDEEDRVSTYFDLNHATHLRFRWSTEHGVGMYFTPYMNGDPSQSAQTKDLSGYKVGFRVGVSNVVGWWDITPKLRIIAGKGGYETIFSPDDPGTSMGYDGVSKVRGLGYGNINSNYQNGVRFTYNFTPSVSLKLGLLESRLTDNNSPNDVVETYLLSLGVDLVPTPYHDKPLLLAETGTIADNNTVLPKLELALPMSFVGHGMSLLLTPSLMYLEQTFDNIAPGADDSILSYGYALGAQLRVGKFSFITEVNIGQNMKNAARIGTSQCYPFKSEYTAIANIQAARADDTGKVYDSETIAGWVEVNYNIGKFQPSLYYGRHEVKRDMPGADSEATTQFYGFNCRIHLAKHFILKPEFMIYDNGDGKLLGTDYEFGQETLAGTQLIWIF